MDLSVEEEDEEIVPEERRMFGSLRQARNTARMIQLFDPGNDAADRLSRPRRKRLSLNEDMFKRELVVRRESLAKGGSLNKSELGNREALYSTDCLRKTYSSKKDAQRTSVHSFGVDLGHMKVSTVERLSSVESDSQYDYNNMSPNSSYETDFLQDEDNVETGGRRSALTPQLTSSSHDTSDEIVEDESLDTMVSEIENIRELLSGLKEKQSATRQLLDNYQSQDYSLSDVYERTKRLRRSKEEALSNLVNDRGGPLLQPSSLQQYETSFFDELNDTDEYWDEFEYGNIIFGESTVL